MRPRERYTLFGPERFTDTELLALIIGLGAAGQSSQELAGALLARFGDLSSLAAAPVEAIRAVPGIGPARAVRLHAALQAGCRAARASRRGEPVVLCPEDAWELLRPGLEGQESEELHALYLNRRRQVLALRPLTRGTDSQTLVEPRQVFRLAVQCGASGVIVAHNHPSGDPSPSGQDLDITRRLVSAGRLLGIELVDHLILGGDGFVSLQRDGHMSPREDHPSRTF